MDPNIWHLVVAGALTLLGVVITALIWRRAQVKTVFWWIGLSLAPIAVYLLGLAPAVVGAYETLVRWFAGLTFTPIVWTGVALAGLSLVLMLGSRLIPSESSADRRAARAASGTPAAGAGRSRPAVGTGSTGATRTPPRGTTAAPRPAQAKPAAPASADGDDFDEIADILRKRGIN